MPFAPQIRKDILNVLEEIIIPALQSQHLTQILAEPPFDFSTLEHQILQKGFLADKEYAPLQTEQIWEKQYIASVNTPTIMFAYDGICYERIGITKETAKQLNATQRKAVGGVNLLQLPAPALLSHPAFMPRSRGVPRPESLAHSGRSLLYRLTKSGIYVALNVRGPEEEYATHNLEINDPVLAQMANLYIEELRARDNLEGARAQQLAFTHRLQRHLLHHRPAISNSCWVIPPKNNSTLSRSLSSKNMELCRDLAEYVIMHLHSSLTLKKLAAHFGVSTVHLNSTFKQAQGITVMRYVTQLRIEAAKKIIVEQPERINDVAKLVGFSSSASFCIVFRKHTGISPNKFRQTMTSQTKEK